LIVTLPPALTAGPWFPVAVACCAASGPAQVSMMNIDINLRTVAPNDDISNGRSPAALLVSY
jgi:hypothetical protein